MYDIYNEKKDPTGWITKTLTADHPYAKTGERLKEATQAVVIELETKVQEFLNNLGTEYDVQINSMNIDQYPGSGAAMFAYQTISYKKKEPQHVIIVNDNLYNLINTEPKKEPEPHPYDMYMYPIDEEYTEHSYSKFDITEQMEKDREKAEALDKDWKLTPDEFAQLFGEPVKDGETDLKALTDRKLKFDEPFGRI